MNIPIGLGLLSIMVSPFLLIAIIVIACTRRSLWFKFPAIGTVLLTAVGVFELLLHWQWSTHQRFAIGGGYELRVVNETWWYVDPIVGYYYEVRKDDAEVVSKCVVAHEPCNFSGTAGAPTCHFSLLKSTDAKAVGLVEDSEPKRVLAVFDTVTAETWPQTRDDDSEETSALDRALFAKLQASHPEVVLVFGRE